MTEKPKLLHEELTREILGSFYTVYNDLGYGFLEQPYANALSIELRLRGLDVEREVGVEVQYRGQPVGLYRLEFVVNAAVVLELKAGAAITSADHKQLFNYLRASRLGVGLLLHFGPNPVFKRITIESRSAVSASSASSA